MNQQKSLNQSGIIETLHVQTGQAPEGATLKDLPINVEQETEVKGGVVITEYLLLGPEYFSRPAGVIAPRP